MVRRRMFAEAAGRSEGAGSVGSGTDPSLYEELFFTVYGTEWRLTP